jgi:hypothetical protein
MEVMTKEYEELRGTILTNLLANEVNGDCVHDTASGMRSMGIMTNSKRKEG